MVFENPEKLNVLNRLRKNRKPIWKRIRKLLSLPKRKKISINISKLSKLAKNNDSVFVVPGKVLGAGIVKNKFTVIGFEYTSGAIEKMKQSDCKYYKLNEIINDKGEIKVNGPFMIVR